jgi:hypothetical protein
MQIMDRLNVPSGDVIGSAFIVVQGLDEEDHAQWSKVY